MNKTQKRTFKGLLSFGSVKIELTKENFLVFPVSGDVHKSIVNLIKNKGFIGHWIVSPKKISINYHGNEEGILEFLNSFGLEVYGVTLIDNERLVVEEVEHV